ncbi:MAG: FAD-dependent oxidoreductase [bacterium]|nr:FAD-dependent oxidoreductase [bacterium]
MPPRVAKLSKKFQFTNDVVELHFESEDLFEFEAGQFVTFIVKDQVPPCFRAYSISTCPEKNSHHFATCLKVIEGGRGSNWLNNLKIGDELNFIGPSGNFIFQNPEKKAFFITTGTGITPFCSMIIDQLQKGNKNNIHLLFGLRHIKHIFYKELLDELSEKYSNFSYQITLSRPEDESWDGSIGRVTKILEEIDIDTQNTDYYICGLKAMIDEVEEILKKKGVPETSMHVEKYD